MEPIDLDRLRRSIDLRLDAEGRWWHDGQPFENERLIALFDRGIDVHPDSGEPILRVGTQWCYFRADDVPFVVRRLVDDGGLVAELNTGERVAVPEDALEVGVNEVVYARLGPRRRARLSRQAQSALAAWLREDEDGLAVVVDGRRWPVRAPASPA
jgi:hypothetical protein